MPLIDRRNSILLIIDFQSRLMPAIHEAAHALANARRLLDAAAMLEVPVLFTEQNPSTLSTTVPELGPDFPVVAKMTFDAVAAPDFLSQLPPDRKIVVAGCEAHVCVLQTVLSLRAAGRNVYAVRDAIGARRSESKETALDRMDRHGAEIVTTEMVLFEWMQSCRHPRFREIVALIR